ncbi:MAG: hypothetical protein WC666_03285 [Candidatus Paceibacterota bacterium]|jgi:hypothetical protein
METTKQYIKNIIKASYPALDLSDGSPLSELFVNPTSAIFDPVLTQLKYLLDNLGLKDPESIHPLELEAIASNFLIYRNQGIPSSGYVEMFYETPQTLLIPAGTQFTTADGSVFITPVAVQIMSNAMSGNTWRFPLYSTGLIPVTAQLTSTPAIGPDEIIDTNLDPAPTLVTNSTGFSVSTATETNTELAERLMKAVLNRSLASAASIDVLLTENFPSIRQTVVIGPTDSRMSRDIFYSGIESIQNYHVVDYRGKISVSDFYTSSGGGVYIRTSGVFDSTANFDQYPYPQSKAYWTLFYDDPATSGLTPDLPNPDEFLLEFSTSMYSSLYYLNDVYKATVKTSVLLDDPFVGGALDPRWMTGDAHYGARTVKNGEEIKPTANGVRLGYTPDSATVTATPITLSRDFLKKIKDAIGMALTITSHGARSYNPEVVATNINEEIERF